MKDTFHYIQGLMYSPILGNSPFGAKLCIKSELSFKKNYGSSPLGCKDNLENVNQLKCKPMHCCPPQSANSLKQYWNGVTCTIYLNGLTTLIFKDDNSNAKIVNYFTADPFS